MKSFYACIVVLALMTACNAESFSMSCATDAEGQMQCVKKASKNGNVASASSNSNGRNYDIDAQAGRGYVQSGFIPYLPYY